MPGYAKLHQAEAARKDVIFFSCVYVQVHNIYHIRQLVP